MHVTNDLSISDHNNGKYCFILLVICFCLFVCFLNLKKSVEV